MATAFSVGDGFFSGRGRREREREGGRVTEIFAKTTNLPSSSLSRADFYLGGSVDGDLSICGKGERKIFQKKNK